MESIEFLENYQTFFVTYDRFVVSLALRLLEKGKPRTGEAALVQIVLLAGSWGQVLRFVFCADSGGGTRGQVRCPAYFALSGLSPVAN
ncbi:hypothetical protein AAEO50_19155 [Rossellomorea oryzaecorticis]|uniref:Uncharacterized protein n=1 Tax=Rossellomorea oryzaecorticis TaxID=1396505 RepID=A0ABU9KE84_9BACI